jgi:hypothetical protein
MYSTLDRTSAHGAINAKKSAESLTRIEWQNSQLLQSMERLIGLQAETNQLLYALVAQAKRSNAGA